jgi:hypothetical protein
MQLNNKLDELDGFNVILDEDWLKHRRARQVSQNVHEVYISHQKINLSLILKSYI